MAQAPACDSAKAQAVVREGFVRDMIINGDRALIVRGAMAPDEAFAESKLAAGMPRMVALVKLLGVRPEGYDAATQTQRCSARVAVEGWADLTTAARFTIRRTNGDWLVESAFLLPEGPEGFNMLMGYRSRFGRVL